MGPCHLTATQSCLAAERNSISINQGNQPCSVLLITKSVERTRLDYVHTESSPTRRIYVHTLFHNQLTNEFAHNLFVSRLAGSNRSSLPLGSLYKTSEHPIRRSVTRLVWVKFGSLT